MSAEVRALYDEVFSEAQEVLRANWRAVKRVAKALLAAGSLDQTKIDQLIGRQVSPEAQVSDGGEIY